MANKKKNKKQNNKQKSNNNKNNKQNQKNWAKNRQNSEQSIDSIDNSVVKTSKSVVKSGQKIDVFGDSDKRIDLNTEEKCLPSVDTTSNLKAILSTNYSPKGLNNLGNTCYLNSVLQIISETHLLFDLLNDRSNDGYVYRVKALKNVSEWIPDTPVDELLETTLGQCFPLTQNLISFMREMRSNGSRTVSPGKVLNCIRKEWTQFDGWAQQDSHELLRCLLDSLKCKEVKRQRRAIMNELKTSSVSDANTDDNNLDDDSKARIKSFATYSYLSPIDTIFGGQLLSSVCCDVCQNTSLKFEPFFDLSLPLTHLTNNYHNFNNNNNNNNNNNKNSVFIEKNKNNSNHNKPNEEKSSSVEDNKKLTPKERRQLRVEKKAAKKEQKLQNKLKNTINIEIKENSDNNCDKNDENITKELDSNENNWPEVNQWTTDGKKEENAEEEDNKESIEEQNISDSNLDLGGVPQEIGNTKGIEDWTDCWVEKTANNWNANQSVTEEKLTQNEDRESDEDIIMEPLLSDFDEKLVISCERSDYNNDTKQCNSDEEVINLDMLYENNYDLDYNKDNVVLGWNDWNDEGWNPEVQPFFGPELPPLISNEVIDEDCDEYKAQEIEFQTPIDCEAELLMSCISDREKLEIKQSTTDSSNSPIDFDPNSEKIKSIIGLCLETIHENSGERLPKFDLLQLLSNFTSIERLTGNNKYFCEMCTKTRGSEKEKHFTNASKRALIALPPPVLTLHLKRFEADGYRRSISLKKISTFVSFPLTFDLSPFVSKMYNYLQPITGQSPTSALIYGLYGVVEHSGSLKSGHYTAYVKFRPNNRNQIKKFAIFEPFLPKVENVLKMIENKFFATNIENSSQNCSTNGHNSTSNGVLTNGTTNGEVEEESEQQYSCSASLSDKWFHISDSCVTSSSVSAVLKSNAYILFYERIA